MKSEKRSRHSGGLSLLGQSLPPSAVTSPPAWLKLSRRQRYE
jgi:hypothetical protein